MNTKNFKRLYTGSIIDMHCHILPNIDDGSRSFEQSINMLNIAVSEGIDTIVSTPHLVCDGSEKSYIRQSIEIYHQFVEKISQLGVSINLRLGYELLLSSAIPYIGDIFSIVVEGTKSLLVELRTGSDPRNEISELLYVLDHENITMILAHPERSKWLHNNISYLYELKQQNVMFQIDADSVTGSCGKDVVHFTQKLVEQGYVQLVGSDAHSDTVRGPYIRQALSTIMEWVGIEETQKIAYRNAEKILSERYAK